MNRQFKLLTVLVCVLACMQGGLEGKGKGGGKANKPDSEQGAGEENGAGAAAGEKGKGKRGGKAGGPDAESKDGDEESDKGEISDEGGGGPAAEDSEDEETRSKKGVLLTEPDLTKGASAGDIVDMALGPTGIIGNLWRSKRPAPTMAQVAEILNGSPASGKLGVGDVIIGLGSDKFKSDVRRELAAAITEAEKQENGGKLVLNVWQKRTGKALPVTLTLAVKGTYSATSPWDCKKTEKLIAEAADYLAGNMPGGIAGNVAVLGLLATGEKKYQSAVRDHAHKAANNPGGGPWDAGYKLIMLSEYYLATDDSSVKSGIKALAEHIARGQSKVGTYGHGYAAPWGGETGYGCMNQCSISCNLGMVLARKCGINSPEVDRAVAVGVAQLRWYADKGRVPYGYMQPVTEDYDSNGRTAQSAVLFDIYGDSVSAESYARCTLASYDEREGGHTGQYWSWLWGVLGAARCGPEASRVFVEKTQWYTELERRHTGEYHYQPSIRSDTGKYTKWDTTGARLLQLCLQRKAIYLTGKGGSSFEPLAGQRLKEAVDAATFDATKCSVNELLDLLGSWSWRVRMESAFELGQRDDDVSEKVVAMLDSPDRLRRFGACMAVRRCGGKESFQKVKDKMLRVIETSKDESEQYYALDALRYTPFNARNGFKDLVLEAAPDLMKLAAKLDAQRTDPFGRIPAEIVRTLWSGANRGGYKGYNLAGNIFNPESCDDAVLMPCIAAGLRNPDGSIRSMASRWLAKLDEKRMEKIWGDIWFAASTGAIGNTMFSGEGKKNCQDAVGRGCFKEGLEISLQDMTRKGWGGYRRIPSSCKVLARYGSNVKPYLPEMTKVYEDFIANRKPNEVEHMKKSWAILQDNVNNKVELRSIEAFIKKVPERTFAVKPLPANGDPAPEVVKKPAQPAQPVPQKRSARSLTMENRAVLDNALKTSLTKLSDGGALNEMAIQISPTRSKVWLKSVADEKLTFQLVGGTQTVPFEWKDLGPADRATLSMLVAALKPDSNDAQAMAGVYLESVGRVDDADKYFKKAGEASSQKLQELLEK